MTCPRILFLALEFETWHAARSHTYAAGLGFEEGFAANQVSFVTLTTPCFRWAQEICRGLRFDQVWLYAVQSKMNNEQRTWVASLAPVRLGLVCESLDYKSEELHGCNHLTPFREELQSWLPYLTHVVAVDEEVVAFVRRSTGPKAFWSPCAVPARFIEHSPPRPHEQKGMFCGRLYKWRSELVERPEVTNVLTVQRSPEEKTLYPLMFRSLQANVQRCLNRAWLPWRKRAIGPYMKLLRAFRRQAFRRWIRSLQSGAAVVNLPSYFKAYSGRVVEGMAAGRPVVSWQIPDRPMNAALFGDGEDILLYPKDDPDKLVYQLGRVLSEPGLAAKLQQNARAKIIRHHTMEHRVRQILRWIENDDSPTFW